MAAAVPAQLYHLRWPLLDPIILGFEPWLARGPCLPICLYSPTILGKVTSGGNSDDRNVGDVPVRLDGGGRTCTRRTARAGHAYSPEQQQACTPDAMRLCGQFVPDVDRITACMSANRALLSPPCRMYFRRGPEPVEIRDEAAGRPMALRSGERKARVGKFRRSAKPQQ